MLHDHEGRPVLTHRIGHGAAQLLRPLVVHARRGFVQQQQPRAHGQGPGERETLFLAPGQRRGGVIERKLQAHARERFPHARPDPFAGDGEVLEAERDVVPHAREDHLRLGVLVHEAHRAAGVARVDTRDAQPARCGTAVRVLVHTGQCLQERGLAGPGRAQKQDAFAGLDDQVQVHQTGRLAAGVMPSEPLQDHPRARELHGRFRGHRRTAPEASAPRTPVACRAFITAHMSSPAITAPESVVSAA